jgi:sRNA-binding protein
MTNPQRTIVALVERFPECFSTAVPRPLQIGIYHSIRAVALEIAADELAAALAAYVKTPAYLKALTARRAMRVNLNGEPVAPVAKEDAKRAERMLAERSLARAAR